MTPDSHTAPTPTYERLPDNGFSSEPTDLDGHAARQEAAVADRLAAPRPMDATWLDATARDYVAARREKEALDVALAHELAATPEGRAVADAHAALLAAQQALVAKQNDDPRTARIKELAGREEAAEKALLAAWPGLIPQVGKSVPLPEGRVSISVKKGVEVRAADVLVRDLADRRLLKQAIKAVTVHAEFLRPLLFGEDAVGGAVPTETYQLSFTAKKQGAKTE